MTETRSELETYLARGDIQVTGRFVYGSNHTFLVEVVHHGQVLPAVYKPSQGERPLWDFPYGTLAAREVAAYRVSRALGWDLVPVTVMRGDGPGGGGSLQQFIQADPQITYFSLSDDEKQGLKRIAAFDALINNADRKGGHILVDGSGHVWSIDHGVCFHVEPKLRSVIWDFAGDPLPPGLAADLDRFTRQLEGGSLSEELSGLLSEAELESLIDRARQLVDQPEFPVPGPDRPYPWPLV